MYFNIIKAEYISDYKINLTFENKKSGIVNLSEYVGSGEVFNNFSNIEYFKNFTIDNGVLTWENGEVDIAPETLYLKTTGEKEIKWNIKEVSRAS